MVQFELEELADPKSDHFARLKMERDPAVCPTTLELRYLRASRVVHPDMQQAQGGNGARKCPVELAIEASSLLNEAQRVLAHPWQRYPYLAELLLPGVMEATKELDPGFLMEAMELGEAVDEARGDAESTRKMKREIEGKLIDYAHDVERRLRSESDDEVREAARLCHEAKYYRRALEILEREETGDVPD